MARIKPVSSAQAGLRVKIAYHFTRRSIGKLILDYAVGVSRTPTLADGPAAPPHAAAPAAWSSAPGQTAAVEHCCRQDSTNGTLVLLRPRARRRTRGGGAGVRGSRGTREGRARPRGGPGTG